MRFARPRHLSLRTELAYLRWTVRFVRFHGLRHPRTLSAAEVRALLSHRADEKNLAASTQNQALNAIVFLYGHVLKRGTTVRRPLEAVRRHGIGARACRV